MPAVKTACPISRDQFRQGAKTIPVTIDGKTFYAEPKEFSTGGLGFYLGDKITVTIDGQPVKLQVGLNLSLIGSKDLPK